MLSGINYNIQLPIAYYFASSLNCVVKAQIVKDVTISVIGCGVELVGLTFDGYRTNPAVCQIFGANLDVFANSFHPSFSINNQKINVIFDPSHVIKLVRGSLTTKFLHDSNGNAIKWNYFKQLVKFKKTRNFSGPIHKLTQAHIDWKSDDMNVRLAVETLSSSTANAIEYLMNAGFAEFAGAEATIKFTRTVDLAFDLRNSTHKSQSKENMFKRPWNPTNIAHIHQKRVEIIEYFKGLQIRSERGNLSPLCSSQNKTGFQGFVLNMCSFNEIYNDLIVTRERVNYLPTHTLSQDHLEQLFGDLRSFNGSNNNPNIVQFRAGIRKVLANTTICPSKKRNCAKLPDTSSVYNPYSNILTITSRRTCSKRTE